MFLILFLIKVSRKSKPTVSFRNFVSFLVFAPTIDPQKTQIDKKRRGNSFVLIQGKSTAGIEKGETNVKTNLRINTLSRIICLNISCRRPTEFDSYNLVLLRGGSCKIWETPKSLIDGVQEHSAQFYSNDTLLH